MTLLKILFLFGIFYIQPAATPDTSPPAISNVVITTRSSRGMLLATITLDAHDPAGIASIMMYYQKTSRDMDYREAGKFKLLSGTTYILYSKPLHRSQFDYRILAIDNYGNATCKELIDCPGATVWVR